MTYLLPFFFLASFYNIFVFLFFKRDKMRWVCVGGNEREREIIENLLLFFFYLLQYVFLKERWQRRYVCGSDDGKELEKCRENLFFLVPYDRVHIYIHILQSQCNPSLNYNEQYKERIGHDNNTLWKSNHNKSEHNINQDKKQIRAQNQSQLVMLILTI